MRFGIVLLPESLAGLGDLCREAEDTGFDLLGVAGAHQFVITSFVPDPRAFMRRWSREVAAPVSSRG